MQNKAKIKSRPNAQEPILRLEGLSKFFGKRCALDRIDLEVYPGEIVGFLGPNGAGKTTAIKTLMGFYQEDAGQVWIQDHQLREEYEKAMENVGGIVENPEMYTHLTGYQNISLYAHLHGIKDRSQLARAIQRVGLESRIKEQVRRYSLGMKQRCGLALALVHEPSLLVLDEPTNGLDPAGIHELRDLLRQLAHEEGVGVLISSHMLSEMQLICDRVVIIDQGRMLDAFAVQDDPIYEARSQKAAQRYREQQAERKALGLAGTSVAPEGETPSWLAGVRDSESSPALQLEADERCWLLAVEASENIAQLLAYAQEAGLLKRYEADGERWRLYLGEQQDPKSSLGPLQAKIIQQGLYIQHFAPVAETLEERFLNRTKSSRIR